MEDRKQLDLDRLYTFQRAFARDREWEQFHTPKNLAMALAGEAGELVEIFQWLTEAQSWEVMQSPDKAEAVRHELADVLYYLARLADVLHVDLEAAIWEKQELNERRYPVTLAKGSAKKYTELATSADQDPRK